MNVLPLVQWWNVTAYIYSSTLLLVEIWGNWTLFEYFHFLLLYTYITLHFNILSANIELLICYIYLIILVPTNWPAVPMGELYQNILTQCFYFYSTMTLRYFFLHWILLQTNRGLSLCVCVCVCVPCMCGYIFRTSTVTASISFTLLKLAGLLFHSYSCTVAHALSHQHLHSCSEGWTRYPLTHSHTLRFLYSFSYMGRNGPYTQVFFTVSDPLLTLSCFAVVFFFFFSGHG